MYIPFLTFDKHEKTTPCAVLQKLIIKKLRKKQMHNYTLHAFIVSQCYF